MDKAEIRRANLKQLLNERFGNRIAEFARKIDRDDAYLWQLLNDDRNVGERVARHIEAKLELAPGALDAENMVGPVTLTPDARELLDNYLAAAPQWKLTIRYVAALRGAEAQDEAAAKLNSALAEIAARAGAIKEPLQPSHQVHEPRAEYRKHEPLFRGREEVRIPGQREKKPKRLKG